MDNNERKRGAEALREESGRAAPEDKRQRSTSEDDGIGFLEYEVYVDLGTVEDPVTTATPNIDSEGRDTYCEWTRDSGEGRRSKWSIPLIPSFPELPKDFVRPTRVVEVEKCADGRVRVVACRSGSGEALVPLEPYVLEKDVTDTRDLVAVVFGVGNWDVVRTDDDTA